MNVLPINVTAAVCHTSNSEVLLGIGWRGCIPWECKRDIARFRRATLQTINPRKRNAVLMGRGTWLSLRCKPLSGRLNVVLSSHAAKLKRQHEEMCGGSDHSEAASSSSTIDDRRYHNVLFYDTEFEEAVQLISAPNLNVESIWAIGGESVFRAAVQHPNFQTLHLTVIHERFKCDTFFPGEILLEGNLRLQKSELCIDGPRHVTFRTYTNEASSSNETEQTTDESVAAASVVSDDSKQTARGRRQAGRTIASSDDGIEDKSSSNSSSSSNDSRATTRPTDDHDFTSSITSVSSLDYDHQQQHRPPVANEKQYLKLVRRLLEHGCQKFDRTNVGTLSLFGAQMRFDLRDNTMPLITTKRVFWRVLVHELLWLVRGCTDADQLSAKNVFIWEQNSTREFLDKHGFVERQVGDLGPIYGFQWRHYGAEYVDRDTDYSGEGIRILLSFTGSSTANSLKLSPLSSSQESISCAG